jgi:hypothetical protein
MDPAGAGLDGGGGVSTHPKWLEVHEGKFHMNEWGCLLYGLPWLIGAIFIVMMLGTALVWVIETFIRGLAS